MPTEVKLPAVGDNVEKGTVVAVLVKAGDTITEGQPIIEIETDKAVVEVPSTAAGRVENVVAQIGQAIPVGGVILTLEGGAASAPAAGGGDKAMQVESAAVAPSAAQANEVAQSQQQNQKEQAQSAPAASAGQTVNLPPVGDNIEKGTVVAVLVKAGDTITEGQPIIEIETDKAVVEVPSTAAGRVESVIATVGQSLPVGGAILTLAGGAAAPLAPSAGGGDKAMQVESAPVAPSPAKANEVAQSQQQNQKEQAQTASAEAPAPAGLPQTFDGRAVVPASPSVRRLARELGVNIHAVQGTGTAGRISEDDVRRTKAQPAGQPAPAAAPAVAAAVATPAAPAAPQAAPAAAPAPLPNLEKWGTVRREDMNGIRKATVRSMTASWSTIPMVTHFDKADITEMEETRKRFGERVQKAGGKLTMTHILMKVVAGALRKYPKFNASLDLAAEQVVYREYVNIGVAVDTPNGLLVPVVRDADRKSITELVLNLDELAGKARDRKLGLEEMQGATFTISNLGGIGGHAFTPIVNAPEVAILGVSRGGMEPRWNKEKGEFEPRNMLPLSLTYDHRLIDGADAARFLRTVCEALEDPFLISL